MAQHGNSKNKYTCEVWRHVKVIMPSNVSTYDFAIQCLNDVPGVYEAVALESKQQISIRYDSVKTSFSEIVKTLDNAHIRVKNTRWETIKHGWFQYTDENAKEHAESPSRPCCNKPPK